MITPEEIEARAKKLWASGTVLRAVVGNDAGFPWPVPFRKPTPHDWLNDFAVLRSRVEALERSSKVARGHGYTVVVKEIAHQKLGRVRTVERVQFDSAQDVAACAGEAVALRRFQALAANLCASEPRLLDWIAGEPFALLGCEAALPRLLAVVEHLQANPRPQRFARELGIAGVDSKFIETHCDLISRWLDLLLPVTAIDSTARIFTPHGFERRYGLRYEEPLVRFRWLDPKHSLGGLSDLTVPVSQFVSYAPSCARVFVTENKISFLTLPEVADALVVFGEGYAIERLGGVPWLERQPLHYWGDVDTHGFAILSRLRGHWPHARSFLMDRETLMSHRELWTEEPAVRRCMSKLPGLTDDEAALYDDLRGDLMGERVRLEQERIAFQAVAEAVRAAGFVTIDSASARAKP